MNAETSCSKPPCLRRRRMEGATSPEESSRQLSVPSSGRALRCWLSRPCWRPSEILCFRAASIARRASAAECFSSPGRLSWRFMDSRSILPTGILASCLGIYVVLVFPDGAGAGQGPVQPGAHHAHLRGRGADRRRAASSSRSGGPRQRDLIVSLQACSTNNLLGTRFPEENHVRRTSQLH